MKRFCRFAEKAGTSVLRGVTLVLPVALTILAEQVQATGMPAHSLAALQTGTSFAQQFGVVLEFLVIFLTLLLSSLVLLMWVRPRQVRTPLRMISAFGNTRVSKAMETDFAVLSPHDSLRRAADLTLAGRQQDIPVVKDSQLQGMVSQENLFVALSQHGEDMPVSEVMQGNYPVLKPDDSLEEALIHLRKRGRNSLPVIDKNRLVGLLTTENAREFFEIQSAIREARRKRMLRAA